MKNYKEYFKNKKITCMGLGLLGGMLNDAKFLLGCGAKLIITDMKTEEELKSSVRKLKSLKNISGSYELHLGGHQIEDFRNADFILQPGNVPVDSPYLLEAQKNNIPIHESESLFFQCAKDITTIGITGTRGKTTTTRLVYEILKTAYGRKVHLAGNIQGRSTLALLKYIKPGDFVVLEMDSWCLHGLGDIKKSPNISIFTNLMPDHLNYYLKGSKDQAEAIQKYFTDKAQIYLNQNKEDFLICGEEISKMIGKISSHKIVAKKSAVPEKWKIKIIGEHNLANIACAIVAGRVLNIEEKIIKKAVENFGGVEGRLEFLREYRGVKIYNDTTATTPEALTVALKSLKLLLKGKGRLITISGGADKKLDNNLVVQAITKYADQAFMLAGSGTETIKDAIFKKMGERVCICDSLKQAVHQAVAVAKKGDILVLSPGFASFGMFKNEYDRGDQFNKIIRNLKS
jgi:UDP-N-acetylmuramoylalanine--D-glutamate ligase